MAVKALVEGAEVQGKGLKLPVVCIAFCDNTAAGLMTFFPGSFDR